MDETDPFVCLCTACYNRAVVSEGIVPELLLSKKHVQIHFARNRSWWQSDAPVFLVAQPDDVGRVLPTEEVATRTGLAVPAHFLGEWLGDLIVSPRPHPAPCGTMAVTVLLASCHMV